MRAVGAAPDDERRLPWRLDRGRVGSNASLLQLVIHDPWFAWLHQVSEVVVRIDEIATGAGGGKQLLGLIAAMWFGSLGVAALSESLNAMYGVRESRSWWRVRGWRVVHLIEHPARRVVHLLADVEAQAPGILRHRLARVVQDRHRMRAAPRERRTLRRIEEVA